MHKKTVVVPKKRNFDFSFLEFEEGKWKVQKKHLKKIMKNQKWTN